MYTVQISFKDGSSIEYASGEGYSDSLQEAIESALMELGDFEIYREDQGGAYMVQPHKEAVAALLEQICE